MCESKIIFMLAPTTKFGTRTFYWHWGVCIVRPWILHSLETKIKWERSGQIYGLHVRAKFWLNSTPLSEAKVSRALTSLDKLIERSIANVIIWQSWCCLFGFGMFVYVIGWNVCAYFFATASQWDAIENTAACKFQRVLRRALSPRGRSKLFELPTLLLFGLGDAPN